MSGCNHSVSVVLNVRFATNGMYAKNNTHICVGNKQKQNEDDIGSLLFAGTV